MLGLVVTALLLPQGVEPPVRFARDVQPILSENCFQCHGPDAKARKARLRLDTRSGALATRDGGAAVVPGQPAASLVLQRLTAADPADRMPPAKTGKQLSAAQIETIRRWIRQGARWETHWSFRPPTRPPLPVVADRNWPRNPIDHFVLARLEGAGWAPSPAADRRTLARRVSLDLTGLPPDPATLRQFLADRRPDAYQRLVDRLLASPHYGERMAMVWLDAARYADTDGYQADATRDNWPWRDWVVDAYNANLPFDRFTIEQFAGDLLPAAGPQQILATCFHRNHMANGEGGRHPEESRVDYVIDRVNTVGTVWLGLTLGCAQCHDHKYDPISQAEYYALSAFFDSIDEDGRAGGGARPFLAFRSDKAAAGLARAEAWLQREAAAVQRTEAAARGAFDAWLAERTRRSPGHHSWHAVRTRSLRSSHGSRLHQEADGTIAVAGPNPRHDDYVLAARPVLPRLTGMRLVVLPGADGRLSLAPDGHVILTNLKVSVRTAGRLQVREVAIANAVADYQNEKKSAKDYGPIRDVLDDDPRTGWSTVRSEPTRARTAVFAFAEPIVLTADQEVVVELRHRSLRGASNIRRFRVEFTDEAGPAVRRVGPTPMEQLAAAGGGALAPAVRDALFEEFVADHAGVRAARQRRDRARQRRDRYRRADRPVKVMVLAERKQPRRTHVLVRGVWNRHGAEVAAGVPAALGAWPADTPRTRLGLARYLVSGDHPLTARVAVNRYWQMYFGTGLVRTPEDFGRQGDQPTHPLLLDWLAREFVESGWDIKHMQRLIVTSATYRQRSTWTDRARSEDPENRLLARAGRFRLPSWMIRDAALRVAGLLTPRRGGPPVFPYQPPGLWADSTMGRFHYQVSVGDDLYRRSLYTFWRRMVAPSAMFDAARRRVCQVRVVRTNTPLQALTLLNDPTYVEAARVLAEAVVAEPGDDRTRAGALVRRVLGRDADTAELAELQRSAARTRRHYAAHPDAAGKLAGQGPYPARPGLDPVEVATFTVLASTILNLDEAITRQ